MASSASAQVSKIEATWSRTAAANKVPRVRLNTDVESKVARCLRDHFAGWSADLIHNVEIDGLSLHARLMRDKALWIQDKALCPMGAPYWEHLRDTYGGGQTIESCLKAQEGLVVSSEMRQAAVEAFERPARRSRMLQYLAYATKANQAEMVGACRWVCRLKPSVTEQQHCCVEVMRFINRLSLHKTFAKEAELMRPKFEQVLLQATSNPSQHIQLPSEKP